MFRNLIESQSHKTEFTRRGSFFLATLAGYAILFLIAGLASIYAYDAQLENQNLEFIALVAPVPEPATPVVRDNAPKPKTNGDTKPTLATRTELIDRIADATKIPDEISAVPPKVPELPRAGAILGSSNIDPVSSGPPGPNNVVGGSGGTGSSPLVKVDTAPPPLVEKPSTPKTVRISSLLNGKATYLPKPVYSTIAKTARAAGPVNVQITIDEFGKVTSARATSGNPILHPAAVQAAYHAKFTPTKLNGVAVKVTGLITYNFVLQ